MSSLHQKPTALAKILGVYRIGYKNSQNNTEKKLDLLVMENLFYGRKMAQVRTKRLFPCSAVLNRSKRRVTGSRLGNFQLCLCCSKVTVRACFLVLWSSVTSCLCWLVQASVFRSLICPCISGVWESIANLIRKMWNLFAEFLEELRLQTNLFRRKMVSYCVVGEKITMFWTCYFLSELLHAWDKIQSSVLFLVKWPLWGNRMKILKWLGKIIFKYRGDAEKEAQTNVTSKAR